MKSKHQEPYYHSLTSKRLEWVDLSLEDQEIEKIRTLVRKVPSFNQLDKMNFLMDYFPKYDESISFISGPYLAQSLSFETFNHLGESLGFWETEDYQADKIHLVSMEHIEAPKIRIEIFSTGSTLTYGSNDQLNRKSTLLLELYELPTGEFLIQKIKPTKGQFELMFDSTHLYISDFKFTLFE